MKIVELQKHRDRDLGLLFEQCGFKGSGAEIGVAYGGNARHIIEHWNGERLWLVDLWVAQSCEVYKECIDGINYEVWYEDVKRLAREHPRIKIIRAHSLDAARIIEDASLDFAYIDANHSYESVIADIEAWFPKIINGGMLCGHDFVNNTTPQQHLEVAEAVRDWMMSNDYEDIEVWSGCTSWFIRKKDKS